MHPNPVFREDDGAVLLARAVAIGFAHIFADTAAGPMVVHAPVTAGPGGLAFHVSRANRIAPHLDGARVLVSVAGPHGYVSPNWYVRGADQVPTWNAVTIEIDGVAHVLDTAGLVAQLDALAAEHEPRVLPANPWTRAKMDPALFDRMLGGIVGFGVDIGAVRGMTKLSQNKPEADRDGVIAGLRASGNDALADVMVAAG